MGQSASGTESGTGETSVRKGSIVAGTGRWYTKPDGSGPTQEDAVELVAAIARDGIVTTLDASNNYGRGESERRIGVALQRLGPGGAPTVQTKVDRDRATGDFSGQRVRESLAESRQRLGTTHLPLVFLHDPREDEFDETLAPGGAVEALLEAQHEGVVGAIGVAGNPPELMLRYLETGLFTAVITHNHYTLIDRGAADLIERAHRQGVTVFNAAPYGGGFLTDWPPPTQIYAYRAALQEQYDLAEKAALLCRSAGVSVGAAALQWSLRDARISGTIIGFETTKDYHRTLSWASATIPAELWDALTEVAS